MNHTLPRRRLFALAFLAAVLLSAFALAGTAAAAPSPSPGPTEPAMSIADLQTQLAGGPVDGYFKTVISGTTITTIPVQVLSLVDGFFIDNSSAILFQASGPDITAIGGIAAGMSGSPLYVTVSGNDYLVGAVSYGDIFTTNYLGLATPVESMTTMEATYATAGSSARLAAPVKTASGTIDSLAFATSLAAARHIRAKAPHAAVMHPLALLEIGGLSPSSRVYKDIATKMEKRGAMVRPAGGGVADSMPSTPLEGGASVAAVLAYGDYWGAWIGTVTYVHDDTVVAMGHPLDGDGDVAYAMGNAWVSGVWSSTLEPYKMVSLGPLQGTVTEDRGFGIVGTTAALPPMATVHATATIQPSGRTVTTDTQIPVWATGNMWWDWLVPDSAYFAIYRVIDQWAFPGSAVASETITVNDGTQDIAVTRTDKFDDDYDVGYYSVNDVYSIFSYLTSNPNGVSPATLVSVDFEATLYPDHNWARIIDVQVPGGLKVGDNTVQTVIRPYGSATTQTVESTLTIPAGTKPVGELDVIGGDWGWYWYSMYFGGQAANTAAQRTAALTSSSAVAAPVVTPPPTTYPTPMSVADLAQKVNGWGHNTDLQIIFYPQGFDSSSEPTATLPKTTVTRDSVMRGYVYKETPRVFFAPSMPVVPAGTHVTLRGWVNAWDGAGSWVTLQKQRLGSTAAPVTVLSKQVTWKNWRPIFSFRVKVAKSMKYTVIWSGSSRFLSGQKSCKVMVMPLKMPALTK